MIDDIARLKILLQKRKAFEGHVGRPGKVGGSLKKGQTHGEVVKAPASKVAEVEDAIPYHPPKVMVDGVTSMVSNTISAYADEIDVMPSALKKELDATIKSILGNNLSIRRGATGARGVAESERFKTQFETSRSGGTMDKELRSKAEADGLGVPEDIPAEKRPVYGYIVHKGGYVGSYGSVEFVMKNEVKKRTTFTVGDSLYNFDEGDQIGCPITKPDIGAYDRRVKELYQVGTTDNFRGLEYIEAQIHGGVNLADVEKVVFHKIAFGYSGKELNYEYEETDKILKSKGIKVEYDKEAV